MFRICAYVVTWSRCPMISLLSGHRGPVQVKKPIPVSKPQRKESPGMQHRGLVGRGQPNVKSERPNTRDGRGNKAKDEKVSYLNYQAECTS